jgi:cytolysin-activating lysine-acyltransferase
MSNMVKTASGESTVTPDNSLIVAASSIADKMSLVSRVITLMLDSEAYLYDSLYNLKKLLIAPIYKDQAFVVVENSKVTAYASWAWLTEEAEQRFIAGQGLEVTDWSAGDRLWLVDVISPMKDPMFLLSFTRQIGEKYGHKGKTIKFRRYNPETKAFDVREVKL